MSHLDFIDDLPDNPWSALNSVCNKIDELATDAHSAGQPYIIDIYEIYVDLFAFAITIITNNNLNVDVDVPPILGDRDQNVQNILEFFERLKPEMVKQYTEFQITKSTEAINRRMGTGFYYEFDDDDIDKIQNLINELRDLISKSDVFEEDHKRRLLNRLERLQSELHKRVSDLDRFWGLVGDAGVMAGKFGEDVKPIVDRIMELGKIIWGAQAKAEELSSEIAFPLLTKDNDT